MEHKTDQNFLRFLRSSAVFRIFYWLSIYDTLAVLQRLYYIWKNRLLNVKRTDFNPKQHVNVSRLIRTNRLSNGRTAYNHLRIQRPKIFPLVLNRLPMNFIRFFPRLSEFLDYNVLQHTLRRRRK